MIEVIKVPLNVKAKSTLGSLIFIAILLVCLSLAILIVSSWYDWCIKEKKREKKIRDEEEKETGQQTSDLSNKTSNKTSGRERQICETFIQVVFGLLKIASAVLYFIGDNLENTLTTYNDSCPKDSDCAERIKEASVYLLALGILGFRFISPLEEGVIQVFKVCQNYMNKNDNNNSNKESDDDEVKHPCYTIIITMLGTIAEADAWYTAITTSNTCNLKKPFLVGIILVIVGLIIYFSTKMIFIWINDNFNKNARAGLIILVLVLGITSVMYILGDNENVLDCYFKAGDKLHLGFLASSFFIFSIITFICLVSLCWEVKKECDIFKEKTSHHDEDIKDNSKSSQYLTE